jgi:acid phosphatase
MLTCLSIAFDENGSDGLQNRVDTILLGNAVPRSLVGTQDATFYNHYSDIATIEANWKLHTLGRYDVGANVFSFVAKKTGDVTRALPNLDQTFLNASYPGVFNSGPKAPLPIPNTSLVLNHRTVLPKIVATWGSSALQKCTTYNGSLIIPSNTNPPVLPAGC